MLEVVFMLQVKRSERGFTPPTPPPTPVDEGVEVETEADVVVVIPVEALVGVDGTALPALDVDEDDNGCSVELSSKANPVTGFFSLLEILENMDPR